ncbi:7TM chemoreceptor [Cooperia oncophora]
MSYIDVVTIIIHSICDSLGMLLNLALLYFVLFRTPSRFKLYAILIGNTAITDFVASFSSCVTQQRSRNKTTNEVAKTVLEKEEEKQEREEYYILKKQQPSALSLKVLIAVVSTPSVFQFVGVSKQTKALTGYTVKLQVILCFANQSTTNLLPIIERELPNYDVANEAISGHTDVFEWKLFTAILHMTVPIFPVYLCILILRRRIIAMLSIQVMSENTKILHKQLLEALTCQAMLPGVFSIGVLCYLCGQLGIYHHPFLEAFTLIAFSIMPLLSPLISLYFIAPYRRAILSLFQRKRRTLPSNGEVTAKSETHGVSIITS